MYRFNGGSGAVTCDFCNVIIDEGLSLKEYNDIYKKANDKDVCWRCKEKLKEREMEVKP